MGTRSVAEALDMERLRRARQRLELAELELRHAIEELDTLSVPAAELLVWSALPRELLKLRRELEEAAAGCARVRPRAALYRERLASGAADEPAGLGGVNSRGGI